MSSTTSRLQTLAAGFLFLMLFAISGYAVLNGWELPLPESLTPAGLLGMAVWLAVQVVIPPLPGGPVIAFMGASAPLGLAFSYAFAGIFIGSLIAYALGMFLGSSFIERFVSKGNLKHYRRLFDRYGELFLLLFFLTPYTADDLLCYVAGVFRFRWWRFVIITFIGRAPIVLLWAGGGRMLAQHQAPMMVMLVALLALFGLVIWALSTGRWKRLRPGQGRG